MPEADERLRSAIHDVVMRGGGASRVVELTNDDKAQGQRVIDLVLALDCGGQSGSGTAVAYGDGESHRRKMVAADESRRRRR
jgi:hypothetical protein